MLSFVLQETSPSPQPVCHIRHLINTTLFHKIWSARTYLAAKSTALLGGKKQVYYWSLQELFESYNHGVESRQKNVKFYASTVSCLYLKHHWRFEIWSFFCLQNTSLKMDCWILWIKTRSVHPLTSIFCIKYLWYSKSFQSWDIETWLGHLNYAAAILDFGNV